MKKISIRRFTEKMIREFYGQTILVELEMPSSKYHGSILRTKVPYHKAERFLLDAPTLPRRLSVHFTNVLRTKETVERLTNTPDVVKTNEFVDFSGHKFKIGDVLFGEGKLIKVTDIRPTLCRVKVLHPEKCHALCNIYYYRMESMKKFLYIKDPTMVLLKT